MNATEKTTGVVLGYYDGGDDDHTRSILFGIAVFFPLIIFCAMTAVFLCIATRKYWCRCGTTNRRVNHRIEPSELSEQSKDTEKRQLFEIIARLPKRERHQYYEDLFRRIENEAILTIPLKRNTTADNPTQSSCDIETGFQASEEEEDNSSLRLKLGTSLQHTSNSKVVEAWKANHDFVHADCIICFENFRDGDTIVFNSETSSCPHMFHKHCMVNYLSQKAIPKAISEPIPEVEKNPTCPTCRQQFCRLLPLLENGDTEQISGANTMQQM